MAGGCGGTSPRVPADSPPDRLLITDRDGTALVHPDGSGRVRVPADAYPFALSPDGRSIATAVSGGLAIVDVASGKRRTIALPRLRSGGDVNSIAWSPGATRLAYARSLRGGEERPWELATIHADGTHRRRLVKTPPGADLDGVDWSPDGRTIVYARAQMVIDAIHPDGTHRRRVFGRRIETIARAPRWSPDGTWLAIEQEDSIPHVVVVRRDGSGRRQLADGEGPVWSPDGRSLVFTPSRGPFAPVVLRLADGSTRRLPLRRAIVDDWRGN